MAKFHLSCMVTVSAYTVVTADSIDEAIREAAERQAVIGGSGSGADETESWVIEEADGSPRDIHAS